MARPYDLVFVVPGPLRPLLLTKRSMSFCLSMNAQAGRAAGHLLEAPRRVPVLEVIVALRQKLKIIRGYDDVLPDWICTRRHVIDHLS